jgi:hypothetical protein
VGVPISTVTFLTFFREEHESHEGEDEEESHGTDGAGLGPNLPPSTVEFGGDTGREQSTGFHTGSSDDMLQIWSEDAPESWLSVP